MESLLSRLQGPGESDAISGLGNGVTSPMALMTGLESRLLLPPKPLPLLQLPLRLGERASRILPEAGALLKGIREGISEAGPSRWPAADPEGGTSVEIRRALVGVVMS